VHDPRGDTKTLESYIADRNAAFRLSYTPPGSSEGNMLYETVFPIVIKPFEGDWYDASNIYRQWALPNADWTKKGRLADRTNIPQWTYNLTTWFMDPQPSTGTVSEMKQITERLGLGKDYIGVHLYNWDLLGRE